MVIGARNPVHSVLFLILAFFNAAGLFVLLGAEFLGDDPGRRLCRRRGGAVPVRGDDARRRLRRAAPGLPQLPAGRRAGRDRPARRTAGRARRLGVRADSAAAPRRRSAAEPLQHGGARRAPLHALRLLLPGGRHGASRRHDRRHRADAAPPADVKRQTIAEQVGAHAGDGDRDPQGRDRGRASDDDRARRTI